MDNVLVMMVGVELHVIPQNVLVVVVLRIVKMVELVLMKMHLCSWKLVNHDVLVLHDRRIHHPMILFALPLSAFC